MTARYTVSTDPYDFGRDRLRRDAVVYGARLDVNPYTVLLEEVQWRAGHVEWLRSKIQELESADQLFGPNRHGELVPVPLVQRYDKERFMLDRAVKLAIDAGIAERYVRLAELHGQVLHQVLQVALNDPLVELTQEQRVGVVDAMKRALAGAGQRRALDAHASPT